MKCAERQAERGEPLSQSIKKAIIKDLNAELSPGFLNSLKKIMSESLDLLPGFSLSDCININLDNFTGVSPLSNTVKDILQARSKEYSSGRELVQFSLAMAINQRLSSRYRQIEEHCHSENGPRKILDVLKVKFAQFDPAVLASQTLENYPTKIQIQTKKPIDLNEDLAAPL